MPPHGDQSLLRMWEVNVSTSNFGSNTNPTLVPRGRQFLQYSILNLAASGRRCQVNSLRTPWALRAMPHNHDGFS
jgi:hypothetical protein